ncbi:MAG TPA: MarR family transcriptional regulator [Candidatus Saccharimonadales bacterium]|nr:MarR family transcriptional regulator [Candidatus Saccharimonadales bacterium]
MSTITTLARPPAKRRLSPEELRAWRAFLRSHATVSRSLERALEGSDLTLAGYGVLVVLSEAPEERLRLHEIAERIGLTKSGLTRLIDRLETRGYVERHACELDKRGQYAVVTAAGRRAFRRAAPGHLGAIAARFADHLTPPELTTLTRALERVALANLATADPE